MMGCLARDEEGVSLDSVKITWLQESQTVLLIFINLAAVKDGSSSSWDKWT
jgi:hypothetical protein